jgi:hypothetical protein
MGVNEKCVDPWIRGENRFAPNTAKRSFSAVSYASCVVAKPHLYTLSELHTPQPNHKSISLVQVNACTTREGILNA